MPSESFSRLVAALRRARDEAPPRTDPVALRQNGESLALPPGDDVEVEQAVVASVPGEWVRVPGVRDDAALVYMHGGGYVTGSTNTHRKLAGDLARASELPVFVADYPLAPENPYPAAVDAMTGVCTAIFDRFGPERVVLGGDSAGGGLVVAVMLKLKAISGSQPAAACCISPWTDLTRTAPDPDLVAADPMVSPDGLDVMARSYLGGADPTDPLVSPVRAHLEGLAPMLIQVGASEMLLDDSLDLARQAGKHNVEVTLEISPHMIHVWHIFAGRLPEATQAVERAARFFQQHLPAQ